MSPSPVGVNGDGTLDICASAGSTLGPGQGRLALGSEGANLLSPDSGDERRSGGEYTIHFEQKLDRWVDELTEEDVM